MVRAVVTKGAKKGTYVCNVSIRSKDSFNVITSTNTVEGIHARYCHIIHHRDGYRYEHGTLADYPGPEKGRPLSSLA